MKAATTKVKVPAMAGRLVKLLQGMPKEEQSAQTSLAGSVQRWFTHRLVEPMGFPDPYFQPHGDFLAGARAAFQHIAATTEQAPQIARSHLSGLLEPGLGEFYGDCFEALEAADLELALDLEEITGVALGQVQLVYGLRRSRRSYELGPDDGRACSYFWGHKCVGPLNDRVMVVGGATLYAEALVTARQTVALRHRGGDRQVLAGDSCEAALHCLRLEAELVPDKNGPVKGSVRFDDARGWIVSDMNGIMGGNCVASAVPDV
jgi:hypothetical protein